MRSIYLLAVVMLMFGCAENKQTEREKTETAEMEMTAEAPNVPEHIRSAFATEHPNAEDVEWETEADKYEVEFEEGDKEMSIIYHADGSLYATETNLAVTALPEAVAKAAAEHGEASEASVLTLADGSMQYEVEIQHTEYLFDANGSLISKSVEEDDDKDDHDDEGDGEHDDDDDDHEGDDDDDDA